MNRRDFLRSSSLALTATGLAPLGRAFTNLKRPEFAEGYVFQDRNGSGKRDEGDPGIAGVCVSNGHDVVRTDSKGRWRLPVEGDTIFYVIKPSGWKSPVDGRNLPQYFHIHKPKGSPSY